MEPSNQFYKQIYSRYWLSKRPIGYINTEFDDFLVSLVPSSSLSVIEACCGNGIPYSRSLAKKGIKVFGFDISEILIKQFNDHQLPLEGVVEDIHTFHTLKFFDCLFIYHSIHCVPEPYVAIKSLVENTPNIPQYIIEFPSIYFPLNSSTYYNLERLHSSRFNRFKIARFIKNIIKKIVRKGTIDRSNQNLYEPLSLFRLIDTVRLPCQVFGVSMCPFSKTEIPYPVSADDIIQYERLVVVFTR